MSPLQPLRRPNRLLQALEPDDLALLLPHLRPRDIPLKQIVIAADAPVSTIVFPESGLVSITADDVEIGMIGREGAVGATLVLLGSGQGPHVHLVQVAGTGHEIDVPKFEAALARSPGMRQVFLQFIHVLMVQMGETATVNGRHSTVVRLARWLLMCDDRIQADDVPITHEFLAVMLGVHRPGVTLAIQALEERHLIRGRRALVQLLDRPGLERFAAASYGMSEAEYARLFGSARADAEAIGPRSVDRRDTVDREHDLGNADQDA